MANATRPSDDVASPYRAAQARIISVLNDATRTGSFSASVVEPVSDYENDTRIFLSIIAFPPPGIAEEVVAMQRALRAEDPRQFYPPAPALHVTVKSVRTISDPPSFSASEAGALADALTRSSSTIRGAHISLEGLLLTPSSAALAGYTDEAFPSLVRKLDRALEMVGLADDKRYVSNDVVFTNLTFVRYTCDPTPGFRALLETYDGISLAPFPIRVLELISSNCAFNARFLHRHAVVRLAPPSE